MSKDVTRRTSADKLQWRAARPTIHNGIQMRSRLEAGFAQWCDRSHIEWEYEPHALSGDGGQWLPDFLLPRAAWVCTTALPWIQVHPTYVEVKYEGWSDDVELDRIARIAESTVEGEFRLILARPDGLEFFNVGDLGFLWRAPLRFPVCDAPRSRYLTTGFQFDEESTSGPWQGEWWRQ